MTFIQATLLIYGGDTGFPLHTYILSSLHPCITFTLAHCTLISDALHRPHISLCTDAHPPCFSFLFTNHLGIRGFSNVCTLRKPCTFAPLAPLASASSCT
jgi:hypothetical protein